MMQLDVGGREMEKLKDNVRLLAEATWWVMVPFSEIAKAWSGREIRSSTVGMLILRRL